MAVFSWAVTFIRYLGKVAMLGTHQKYFLNSNIRTSCLPLSSKYFRIPKLKKNEQQRMEFRSCEFSRDWRQSSVSDGIPILQRSPRSGSTKKLLNARLIELNGSTARGAHTRNTPAFSSTGSSVWSFYTQYLNVILIAYWKNSCFIASVSFNMNWALRVIWFKARAKSLARYRLRKHIMA